MVLPLRAQGLASSTFLAIVGVLSLLVALGVVAFDVRPQSWLALLAAVVSAAVAFASD